MKVCHKVFFSFTDEKRWLEKMNLGGYELMSASLFRYVFKKTDVSVQYEYIPLRHGRKSYSELKKSGWDKSTSPVYANSELALFKKPARDGDIRVMAYDKKRLAFMKYRMSVYTNALVMLGLCALFVMLAGRLGLNFLYIPSALLLAVTAVLFYQSGKAEKYIRTLK